MNLINEISNKLFSIFYVDDKKFGRQQKDGSYKLVKRTITPVTIDDMLLNQKSLLTYQELHVLNNARIKWICIDLDISKKEIDINLVNSNNLKKVKEAADNVCNFLIKQNIPFLLEFSGRRGFHVWVIFEKLVSKESGYKLIEYIHKNVKDKFDPIIIADKFPKTPYVSSNTKGIGFGIKLPLSQNKGNGKLSFFLSKEDNFSYDENDWLSEPNHEFLNNQLEILDSLVTLSNDQLQKIVDEFDSSLDVNFTKERFLRSKRTDSSLLPNSTSLEVIVDSLSKCDHIKKLLFEYQKGLGGKERSILVGLLINLRTDEDSDFGYNILFELFSNIQGFDKEKTVKNLNNLSYFQPITCNNLGKCSACNECKLFSPVELIKGVNLVDKSIYHIKNIDRNLFTNLKNSLYQYSLKNDEVPLYPQLKKLENLEFKDISNQITEIYSGKENSNFELYKFERNEIIKTRSLYNLDPVNNMISTYFTFLLNTIYYSEISNNSYGYQFSQSLSQNNLFNNWFINWAKYTKKIETVLFSEEYEDFYLLKIDIKSFYDTVDIQRLRIKLFEEAPFKIRQKINELSEEDNEKYKNIINYLTDLSSKTTGVGGLPQGPAYARYLAELYLNGLDSLIENFIIDNAERGFYNRFVDDIFIFIDSKESAEYLFKKIREWLSVNRLDLNLKKTKLINVKDYVDSGEYHRFKDDVKYDINRTNKNKNVLSEKEIEEAFSKLDTLTDDFRFGLKDNLRFFYYQFKQDKRLDFIRKKLSKKLPFSTNGRGALYMIFYSDLIDNNPKDFWELINDLNNIKGLSLTHFLNTILLNEELIAGKKSQIEKLINENHFRDDLTNADRLLIASICFKSNIILKLNYSMEIINSALENPDIKYEIEHWDSIKGKLIDINDKLEFLQELNRIIHKNTYTIAFLNELSSYSFTRFTLWKEKGESDFINNHETLILFYHCLCFLTLFENSQDYNNVKFSWELLLYKSQENGEIADKDYEFTWINKLEDFNFKDFSNGSYTFMLSNFLGANYSIIKCKNLFLRQYKNVLLILLFAKDKENKFVDFRDNISKFIEDKESLFYNWVTDPNVNLYPIEDEICLKNIALNGLVVLKREDSIFVKSINKELQFNKYDYLNIKGDFNAQEVEYSIEQTTLEETLSGKSVAEILYSMASIMKEHDLFISTFKTNYPVFYKPYYSFGNYPMVPYYSDFESIINQEGNISDKLINSYWNNLYGIAKKFTDIFLVDYDSLYNFNMSELDQRFFPISDIIINSVEEKILFLKKFAHYLSDCQINTIFDYQYCWSATVYSLIIELLEENNSLIYYLKIHFDSFVDDIEHKDILFAVDESIIIEDASLSKFFDTIMQSFQIFQNEIKLQDFNFELLLSDYMPILKFRIDDEDNFGCIDYAELILSEIKVFKDRDYKKETVSYNFRLLINGETIENIDQIYIYNSPEFELIRIEDLSERLNKTKLYSFKDSSGRNFIYLPDQELIKAFDRIIKRKAIYDSSTGTSDLGSLFPINPNYVIARKALDAYAGPDLIDNLKIHYVKKIDIKRRVSNWLSLFNEETLAESQIKAYMYDRGFTLDSLYKSIILILNAHYSIDIEDLSHFKDSLMHYNSQKGSSLLTIKNPHTDENGLFRLMKTINMPYRSIVFLDNFNKICKSDNALKQLIIVTDISISGRQLEKAMNYYLKDFSSDSELIDYNSAPINGNAKSPVNERYFTFSSLSDSVFFKNNFEKVESLLFLSPIITQEFIAKMGFLFPNKELTFVSNKSPLEKKDYVLGSKEIHEDSLELFKALIQDVKLIRDIFGLNAEEKKNYISSIANFDDLNLLFRVESLPSKHIKLFSLKSQKGTSLLDYIRNFKVIKI